MSDVTLRQLLEAGVHFGHQTRYWCPKMSPYIYGHRNKIHIINLEQTLVSFNEAMEYLKQVASKRGKIMFVGTKRQAGSIIQEQAQRADCPYVYHRWLGGMLTNYRTVRKSIDRLTELEETLNASEEGALAKRELLRMEREHFRLNRNLAGIRDMGRIPDVLFVIDVRHENIAVLEAQKLGIPVVAVVDTNCDPDGIDYVIPGNDDAISAIRLFCTVAADTIIAGRELADEMANEFDLVEIGGADDAAGASLSMHGVTGAQAAVAPTFDDDPPPEEIQPVPVDDAPQAKAEAQASAEPAAEVTPSEPADEPTEAAVTAEAEAPAEVTAEVTPSEPADEPTEAAEAPEAETPAEATAEEAAPEPADEPTEAASAEDEAPAVEAADETPAAPPADAPEEDASAKADAPVEDAVEEVASQASDDTAAEEASAEEESSAENTADVAETDSADSEKSA